MGNRRRLDLKFSDGLMNRLAPVFKGTDIDELNMRNYTLDQMAKFVIKGTTIEKLLRNLRFIRPDGQLTVAAILLFGKYTQRWLPVMTAKCISYVGDSIGGTLFRDKMHDMEIEGNLLHQFRTIMNFFTRNLRKVQVEKEFNSLGVLEIPYESLTEYVVNALVHRSLNIKAPIRIFIFDNRVEIHSPGALPNGLTIRDIKNGTSMPRNMFLFTNANYLLPYTGAGSGVRRALEYDPDAVFSNGVEDKEITHAANEFVITIPRKSNQDQPDSNLVTHLSNQVVAKNTSQSNQANEKSNQLQTNLVTRKLTKKEEDIRNFCSVPRTAQEIMDRIGITNQSKNRQRYITSLLEIGVIERTIPDKPNDPHQKYRCKK